MLRECKNHPDKFCYVCEKFTIKSQQHPITNSMKKIYRLYFGCLLGDQNKSWAPHIIWSACYCGIWGWLNEKKSAMPFAIPIIWREPKDQLNDCYCCHVDINGFSSKNGHPLVYPSLDSAVRPVLHDITLPIPVPPEDALTSVHHTSDSSEVESCS